MRLILTLISSELDGLVRAGLLEECGRHDREAVAAAVQALVSSAAVGRRASQGEVPTGGAWAAVLAAGAGLGRGALITRAEAARRLAVAPKTLSNQQALEPLRDGRRTFYLETDVEELRRRRAINFGNSSRRSARMAR